MQDEFKRLNKEIKKCAAKYKNTYPFERRSKYSEDFRKIASYAVDFFSCALGGTIIGYIIDDLCKTKYVFIISLFLLGIVAGVYNVLKRYKHL